MIKIIKKRQRKDGYATIFHCIDFSHLKNKKFSCFSFGLLRVFFGKTPLFSKKTRRSIEEDPKDSNTRVVKCGQTWTNMVKCGQMWSKLVKTGQTWSIVVISGQINHSMFLKINCCLSLPLQKTPLP